LLKNI